MANSKLFSTFSAVFIHLVLRWALFIEFRTCSSKTLSDIPSFLILASVALILHDREIVPNEYRENASIFMHIFLETIMTLFLIEVFMSMIWSHLEVYAEFGLRWLLNDVYAKKTNTMVDLMLTILAGLVLLYSVQATKNWYYIPKVFTMMKHFFLSASDGLQSNRQSDQGLGCNLFRLVLRAEEVAPNSQPAQETQTRCQPAQETETRCQSAQEPETRCQPAPRYQPAPRCQSAPINQSAPESQQQPARGTQDTRQSEHQGSGGDCFRIVVNAQVAPICQPAQEVETRCQPAPKCKRAPRCQPAPRCESALESPERITSGTETGNETPACGTRRNPR